MKLWGFIISCCLVSSSAFSADWTPVFDHLEDERTVDSGKILSHLMENIFIADSVNSKGKFKKDVLTYNAKVGDFNIPMPYKQDILPARLIKSNGEQIEAEVPLKNATLYGYKITGLSYWHGCTECGDVGFTANFAPMTEKQYSDLKRKAKFATLNDDICGNESAAKVIKEKGKVYIALGIGC